MVSTAEVISILGKNDKTSSYTVFTELAFVLKKPFGHLFKVFGHLLIQLMLSLRLL